jgi:hypothetical protein
MCREPGRVRLTPQQRYIHARRYSAPTQTADRHQGPARRPQVPVQGVRRQARLRPVQPGAEVPLLRPRRGDSTGRRLGRGARLRGVPEAPRRRRRHHRRPLRAGPLPRLRRGRVARRQGRHRPLPLLLDPPGEPARVGRGDDPPGVAAAVRAGPAPGPCRLQRLDRQPVVRAERVEAVGRPGSTVGRLRPVLDLRRHDLHALHRPARR